MQYGTIDHDCLALIMILISLRPDVSGEPARRIINPAIGRARHGGEAGKRGPMTIVSHRRPGTAAGRHSHALFQPHFDDGWTEHARDGGMQSSSS